MNKPQDSFGTRSRSCLDDKFDDDDTNAATVGTEASVSYVVKRSS